jgi:hypothetical protein
LIYFVVPRDTDFGIRDHLELRGASSASRVTILHYDDLPRRSTLPGGVYIFSALDQLLPAGRRLAGEVADQLERAGQRVLNHPARPLRRFDLLQELFRRGLNRHRAARASADLSALRYPVFLREEHQHTGALTALLRTSDELRAELGRARVRGLRMDDLLVVEFCDTADGDGYYRKYAAFTVGSEIIPRALERGRVWALKHGGADFTRESLDEERAYVLGNPHAGQLRPIFDAARVDYGRIDYALKGGVVETWEINLNPTIGRGSRASSGLLSPEIREYRAIAREHFYRRFQAAFEAIDAPGAPASIPIRYQAGTLEGLGPMSRPATPPRRLESVKRVLRPFRPLLDPLVKAMLPLLGRPTTRKPPSPEP